VGLLKQKSGDTQSIDEMYQPSAEAVYACGLPCEVGQLSAAGPAVMHAAAAPVTVALAFLCRSSCCCCCCCCPMLLDAAAAPPRPTTCRTPKASMVSPQLLLLLLLLSLALLLLVLCP
jgi:hypothetical protein